MPNQTTKNDIEIFAPHENEKLEILVDLVNGDYTLEALRQDLSVSLVQRELDSLVQDLPESIRQDLFGGKQ